MKKTISDPTLYNRIISVVVPLIMKNGFKATTMDSIAATLQISKRTLYELFESKNQLFREAHLFYHNQLKENLKEIFDNSSNVMEAIVKCFLFNRDLMSKLNVDFLKDMEELQEHSDLFCEEQKWQHYQNLYEVLKRGVDEGYFRNDVNLLVQCRMLIIQMQSLKRTEELFPKDISLLDVYDSIILGFLRGISSEKGLAELEKFTPNLSLN